MGWGLVPLLISDDVSDRISMMISLLAVILAIVAAIIGCVVCTVPLTGILLTPLCSGPLLIAASFRPFLLRRRGDSRIGAEKHAQAA